MTDITRRMVIGASDRDRLVTIRVPAGSEFDIPVDAEVVAWPDDPLTMDTATPMTDQPLTDPRADWPAVERLAFEAAIRGDITRSRAAEIVGLRLRTWLDRFAELADEGDDALLDRGLKGWRER